MLLSRTSHLAFRMAECQPGDETHETDHPPNHHLDHGTYYNMEEKTEQADNGTHHKASHFTTAKGHHTNKRDSLR